MTDERIYLSPPHLTGAERPAIEDVLDSNWVAPAGPHLGQFEHAIAEQVGVRHALAVSSGTAALHLILRSLELDRGDEVICPTLTFCASANPIVYEGARPVFLDADATSWTLDPQILRQELQDRARRGALPRAVIAVDLFGQCADFDAIESACLDYEVPLIEDAAEGLGATYKSRKAGAAGWASILSFNGNKIITTSGGGAICSNDEQLIRRAAHLATQAREPAPWYEHKDIGNNYRLSNLLAAIGIAQLASLGDFVEQRRRNYEYYRDAFESIDGIAMMPEASYGRSSRWLTAITIDQKRFGRSCEEVRQLLDGANVESRRIWKPLHLQPAFSGCEYRGRGVAERLFDTGLCLPSGSALTRDQLHRVASLVISASPNASSKAA